MQRGKIQQAHRAKAIEEDKPKIKKLTKEKVHDVVEASATDHLDLTNRSMETIEANAFVDVKKMKRLDLSMNKLTRVTFGHTMALTQLKITSNLLTDVGITDLSFCKQLVTLDLSDNKLARLPGASLRHCSTLKALVLTKNALTSLDWLPSLPGLTSLIVSHNRITEVSSKSLGKLKGLTKLSISYNKLKELPDMSAIENLTELRASNNQLTALPSHLNQNVNLKIVDVCHNAIDTFEGLDDWATSLTNLRQLNLKGNPLCGKDSSVVVTTSTSTSEQDEPKEADPVDEKERKVLDKKNKLYNFKMKRLFPNLIVRDGQRIQDKRTFGYVAPLIEPKPEPKPEPKQPREKKHKKKEVLIDNTADTIKESTPVETTNEPVTTTKTPDAEIKPEKQQKKSKRKVESTQVDEPKTKRIQITPSETTTDIEKNNEETNQTKSNESKSSKKNEIKKTKRTKKEKYVKDSGVLSIVHVKKPKELKKSTIPMDITQFDTSGDVGLGGDSSWD